MKVWLYILMACAMAACNRKAAMQKSSTTDKSIEVKKFTDSSFTITQSSSKEYYDFGDTLSGSILAVDSVTIDSIESSGIKTTVTVTRQSNGSTKVKINSIAKPKTIMNEKQGTTAQHNGISAVESKKHDVVTIEKTKQVESSISWLKISTMILFVLMVAWLIWYIKQKLKS